MSIILAVLLGYLLGSMPFGYFISKTRGIDIREYGSGNIGFTNVLRVVGARPATIVLILDSLKGYLAVYFGFLLTSNEGFAILAAMAALLGHMFPFLLGFRGGKGVATGFGIMVYLAPMLTLVAAIVFLATVVITRMVSLGSILAAITIFLGMLFLQKPLPYILFATIGAFLVIFRHRENMKRILGGTENKVFQRKNRRGRR